MAVELSRVAWLQAFIQMRSPNGFLSRQFTIKPNGISNSDKVAFDIQRFGEDVAVAITKFSGPNLNDFDTFTTKEFTPPAYAEAFPANVNDLVKRMIGVDPYSAVGVSYLAQLMSKLAQGFTLCDDKISRAVELQASQILQVGKLSLKDKDGKVAYELDFKPKSTHFPTATPWSGASGDPLGDLEALAKVIRADGKKDCNQLFFGETALRNFLANDEVKERLDNTRYEMGEIRPEFANSGATFQGRVWIGNYRFEMWSYPETYTDPETGATTSYITADKVIMKSDTTRLDMASCVVPLPLGPDPRVASLIPPRLSDRAAGFDVTPNVYVTPNGKQITGELESRTICIPVQIDGFGCIKTEA